MQKALDALERAGILVSRPVGNTLEYEFNPQYALRDELRALLEQALLLYPEALRNKLLVTRKRPRRKGKPLCSQLPNQRVLTLPPVGAGA